ncbi:hypothetical protein LTR10_023922 [Elasticomyces elasticus]|uniref:Uncharacterized protein n=1 Tax=Exophiala sideris TaxID=1016849 RepID=A0ABR0IVQ9_9EURO|nr:hypothetical protein LTR10_023922 [Elasticomyces elasticus]KAK5020858.1 hypothetical protein LTS07_011396 [Exophiala sideris]KAK5022995.1 hypothetical protein LTR13_011365 [Exophiala sideris]KAK5048398.1 hypothetical protein LTR69_011410 [Exophiala sideris]KAK5176046.1 hypothetical protein LTR44_011390 [Eurotiomycetes sp. CCFEE 6388]
MTGCEHWPSNSQTVSQSSRYLIDVRNSKSVNDWIESIVNPHGNLVHAANIAGIGDKPGFKPQSLKDTLDENWNFVLGANATGV